MQNFDRQTILEWLLERRTWLREGTDPDNTNYFVGAILNGEDLRKYYLKGINFEGADLRWAKLREAELQNANVDGADFRYADLVGGNLQGVFRLDANFHKAKF